MTNLKLWKGNKTDGKWSLNYEEIAKRFLASSYNSPEWLNGRGLMYALICFISGKDGLDSIWKFKDSSSTPLEPIYDIIHGKGSELKYGD